MMRHKKCPKCKQEPVLLISVDTYACIDCNIYVEPPHKCNSEYGYCDAGFIDAPQYPKDYKGPIGYPPKYK